MDDAEDQQLRKEMVVSQKEVGGSAQDLSNEKRAPGCSFRVFWGIMHGLYTSQLYRDFNKHESILSGSLLKNQYFMESKAVLIFVAHLIFLRSFCWQLLMMLITLVLRYLGSPIKKSPVSSFQSK